MILVYRDLEETQTRNQYKFLSLGKLIQYFKCSNADHFYTNKPKYLPTVIFTNFQIPIVGYTVPYLLI